MISNPKRDTFKEAYRKSKNSWYVLRLGKNQCSIPYDLELGTGDT